MLLPIFLPALLVATGPTTAAVAVGDTTCHAGVTDGSLAAGGAVEGGNCAGTNATDGSFVCGGACAHEHSPALVTWRSPGTFLGTDDFTISTSLLLETVDATAAALVLFSGKQQVAEYLVNLDCGGKILCYQGPSPWCGPQRGPKTTATPASGRWFNLTLTRASGKLTVTVGNAVAFSGISAMFPVEGFGLRPWRSTIHVRSLTICAPKLPAAPVPPPPPTPNPPCPRRPHPPAPPTGPKPNVSMVFPSGMDAPGLPRFKYNFGIPALQLTPKGNLLAFCQANLAPHHTATNTAAAATVEDDGGLGVSAEDGNGGWTDIALRRSTDGGQSWGQLQIICRNSTLGKDGKRDKALEHSCQQPAPVADHIANKIIFLSSMDNW
eukprot:SAG11_NODE_2673_length_3109_cov_1.528904_6_plen_380_part_00